MANEEMIRSVVKHIEAEPHRWDQKNYTNDTKCGTAYCVAGWALALAGFTDDQQNDEYFNNFDEAQKVLGLTHDEADAIFYWQMSYFDRPTVAGLKEHITDVTGVTFDAA